MRILFVDPVCPKPYDPQVLATQPLGGTEATVVRVAEGLLAKGLEVRVAQHNRVDVYYAGSAVYQPFGSGEKFKPTHVVVLRAPMALKQARKQFPNAKLYFWAHDIFGGGGWSEGFQAMVDTQAVPIVVSEWHRGQMYDAMRQVCFQGAIPCRRLYNPIADDLVPDETPVDPKKLVFFSSPHKGLEHTLKVFSRFQDFEELKDVQLYLANPGYFEDAQTGGIPNVINLGALPHREVINQVRSALGVFHLNAVFPETFGLVYAEANAVGTPFITSRMGAVPEIVDHPAELIDVTDPKAVIDRIRQWVKYGRPKVRGNPNFRLSRVVSEWVDFLKL
jgi:glycosyltransferase involved in cell wall biosynthesis